ncbi:MAG: hypothetical protein ABWZ66_06040 [Pyrinomonadaceae bacterium]
MSFREFLINYISSPLCAALALLICFTAAQEASAAAYTLTTTADSGAADTIVCNFETQIINVAEDTGEMNFFARMPFGATKKRE